MRIAAGRSRILLCAALLGALIAGAPPAQSHAGDHPVNFPVSETIPCSVALTVDVCAYNPPMNALGYAACENPFPEESIFDIVTEAAPTPPAGKKMILQVETFPQIDWDSWICALLSSGSHNGGELAQGANILGQNCDNLLGPDNPVFVGCQEKASTPAEAGKKYVLRAYNYFDVADDPGIYRWVFV